MLYQLSYRSSPAGQAESLNVKQGQGCLSHDKQDNSCTCTTTDRVHGPCLGVVPDHVVLEARLEILSTDVGPWPLQNHSAIHRHHLPTPTAEWRDNRQSVRDAGWAVWGQQRPEPGEEVKERAMYFLLARVTSSSSTNYAVTKPMNGQEHFCFTHACVHTRVCMHTCTCTNTSVVQLQNTWVCMVTVSEHNKYRVLAASQHLWAHLSWFWKKRDLSCVSNTQPGAKIAADSAICCMRAIACKGSSRFHNSMYTCSKTCCTYVHMLWHTSTHAKMQLYTHVHA